MSSKMSEHTTDSYNEIARPRVTTYRRRQLKYIYSAYTMLCGCMSNFKSLAMTFTVDNF